MYEDRVYRLSEISSQEFDRNLEVFFDSQEKNAVLFTILLNNDEPSNVESILQYGEFSDIKLSPSMITAFILSLIHISEPTRPVCSSRMPSSA